MKIKKVHAWVFGSLIATGLSAMEYYVSLSGKDANSGTSSQPFRTIQRAAGKVQLKIWPKF